MRYLAPSTLIDPACSALVGGSGIVYALLGLFIADQIQYLRTTEVHKRSFGLVIIMLVVKGAGKKGWASSEHRPGQIGMLIARVCFFSC